MPRAFQRHTCIGSSNSRQGSVPGKQDSSWGWAVWDLLPYLTMWEAGVGGQTTPCLFTCASSITLWEGFLCPGPACPHPHLLTTACDQESHPPCPHESLQATHWPSEGRS